MCFIDFLISLPSFLEAADETKAVEKERSEKSLDVDAIAVEHRYACSMDGTMVMSRADGVVKERICSLDNCVLSCSSNSGVTFWIIMCSYLFFKMSLSLSWNSRFLVSNAISLETNLGVTKTLTEFWLSLSDVYCTA